MMRPPCSTAFARRLAYETRKPAPTDSTPSATHRYPDSDIFEINISVPRKIDGFEHEPLLRRTDQRISEHYSGLAGGDQLLWRAVIIGRIKQEIAAVEIVAVLGA